MPSNARLLAATAAQTARSAFVPAGVVQLFAGSSAPAGWLLCAGQTVSRATYADLFAVIGTTYGAGDGSATFALPDLRGRVPGGKDDMGGTAANRLTTAGSGVNANTGGDGPHNNTQPTLALDYIIKT